MSRSRTIKFSPAPKPPAGYLPTWKSYLVSCRFSFDKEGHFRERLKALPGFWYAKQLDEDLPDGLWLCAIDIIPQAIEIAKAYGYSVVNKVTSTPHWNRKLPTLGSKRYPTWSSARDYQLPAVARSLRDRAHLISFEMGLGKTFVALMTIMLARSRNILIIAPKMAGKVWEDQIEIWLKPALIACKEHRWLHVRRCKTGKDVAAMVQWLGENPIQSRPPKSRVITIVSYGLAQPFVCCDDGFDQIVCDESHYVKSALSQRSEAVAEIREENPGALFLHLSGTPLDEKVQDLWHQLHLLYPRRYGHFWQFVRYYCTTEEIPESPVPIITGLKPEKADELRERVALVSTRVTKAEVADQLPPIETQVIRMRGRKAVSLARCVTESGAFDADAFDRIAPQLSKSKIKEAAKMAKDYTDGGVTHMAFLTYFKKSNALLTKAIADKGYNVLSVSGDQTEDERHKIIAKAAKMRQCHLVCNMDAIAVAIDLTRWSIAMFVELHNRVGIMRQGAARFHRLNSIGKVLILLLVAQGTTDEPLAAMLRQKLEDSNSVIEGGQAEKHLAEILNKRDMSDAEMREKLNEVTRAYLDGEALFGMELVG